MSQGKKDSLTTQKRAEELFKLLNLETQQKREIYLKLSNFPTEEKETKQIVITRLSNKAQAIREETINAELELYS